MKDDKLRQDECTVTCGGTFITFNDPGQCGAFVPCGSLPVSFSGDCESTFIFGCDTFVPVGVNEYLAGELGGPECTGNIVVIDDEPPVITCPSNQVVFVAPGLCEAVVNYPPPMATDNCPGVTFSCDPPPGSTFPLGTTTVTCTATDASDNVSSCTFAVIVLDNEPPTITCPINITLNNDPGQCGAVFNFAAIATNNCPGTVNTICSPAPGSFFPVGTTTVTCLAFDPSGNNAACTFSVTILDAEPPMIICPADISVPNNAGLNGATVTFPTPIAFDNCAIASVSCVPSSGSFFPLGTTQVTCTAVDTSGNTASCTFNVTVSIPIVRC
ncbi:MAG: HYR domain-containing protein [Bacillota bacterium]